MIRIDFLADRKGSLLGFAAEGHSGYAEQGEDIVCAAVSSAMYLAVNTVTDVLHVSPMALRVEDGNLFFRIEPKDEEICRAILAGLKLHLTQLEEQYPEFIQVDYLEV